MSTLNKNNEYERKTNKEISSKRIGLSRSYMTRGVYDNKSNIEMKDMETWRKEAYGTHQTRSCITEFTTNQGVKWT